MPNDYITLNALAQEINAVVKDCKIDKVNMPEKDEVGLNIRGNGTNKLLTLSCNANNPRIHIGGDRKSNPFTAPSFCMHLRKHLTGGIINSVSTLAQDRIICFHITSHNEMRDKVDFALIAEMMGRYSNILLVKSNGVISDTLKQVSYDTMTKRCLLPGAKYSLPPQNKLLPGDFDKITELLKNYNGSDLAKFIISNVSGLALITARQMLCDCKIDNSVSALNLEQAKDIAATLQRYCDIFNNKDYSPCVLRQNGEYSDFFIKKYDEFNGLEQVATLNDGVLLCTVEKDRNERRAEKTKFLQKAYASQRKKILAKLAKNHDKLEECKQADELKKFGDLILSNIYSIRKGDKIAKVVDYWQSDCPVVEIKLDDRLTPQQNSQIYYKKYAKLKRAFGVVNNQIEMLEEDLQYLDSIAPALNICSNADEIAELQQELANIGALKKIKTEKNKSKPSQPIAYEVDEFVILVGKNNIQNDKLTFKVANGGDLWIHTQKAHGSHVIVFAEGREIPDYIIEIACEIAAYYSLGNNTTKQECDYTFRRNLKRHPSGKPGMVLYTTYKTAFVAPNKHDEYLAK
ncbi:MAG: NFACT family protein [Clostridia bacterium]|nr:NFACT family protein [Clostridia bacterium]